MWHEKTIIWSHIQILVQLYQISNGILQQVTLNLVQFCLLLQKSLSLQYLTCITFHLENAQNTGGQTIIPKVFSWLLRCGKQIVFPEVVLLLYGIWIGWFFFSCCLPVVYKWAFFFLTLSICYYLLIKLIFFSYKVGSSLLVELPDLVKEVWKTRGIYIILRSNTGVSWKERTVCFGVTAHDRTRMKQVMNETKAYEYPNVCIGLGLSVYLREFCLK